MATEFDADKFGDSFKYDEADRQRRINSIRDTAHASVRFVGYGGMSPVWETLVFGHDVVGEVRLPVFPEAWQAHADHDGYGSSGAGKVGEWYGCCGLDSWDDFDDIISEYEPS